VKDLFSSIFDSSFLVILTFLTRRFHHLHPARAAKQATFLPFLPSAVFSDDPLLIPSDLPSDQAVKTMNFSFRLLVPVILLSLLLIPNHGGNDSPLLKKLRMVPQP
jgi:hypothetical protein